MITNIARIGATLVIGGGFLAFLVFGVILPISATAVMPIANQAEASNPQFTPVPPVDPCPAPQKLPRNFKSLFDTIKVPGQLSSWIIPGEQASMVIKTMLPDPSWGGDIYVYVYTQGIESNWWYQSLFSTRLSVIEKNFQGIQTFIDYTKANDNVPIKEGIWQKTLGCNPEADNEK